MSRGLRHGVVMNTSKAFTGELSRVEVEKPVTGESLKVTAQIDDPNNDGAYAVRINPQKDTLVVGFGNGVMKVFSLTEEGQEEIYKLTAPSSKSAPIFSIRFHPNRETRCFYATGPLGHIYVSRLRSSTFQTVAIEDNQTMGMDINSVGDQLVTVGSDLNIRFYDTRTMQIANTYDSDEMNRDNISGGNFGHTLRLQSVKFHPQHPDMLFTGGWDKMLKIWDRRFAKGLVKTIIGPYIYGDGIDVREKEIATASWLPRGSLQLWDLHSGNLINTLALNILPVQAEHLYFCQFCLHGPDCPLLFAGGSGTKNIQAVNTVTTDVTGLIPFNRSVTSCHTVGHMIAAGCTDGSVKLIRIAHPPPEGPSKTYVRRGLRRTSQRSATKTKIVD